MTQQFTASEVHERERFEEWYTTHARNYSRDPIGSRDCSLQWESWKAALATHCAQAQPPADIPRDVLLDKSLREYAHELRREACSAWSAVAVPCDRIDEAKCEYANAVERRLKVVINELADLSATAQPPAASVTDAMVERAQDCLHDKGKGIGYYHMRAALEAAIAAQENPNG